MTLAIDSVVFMCPQDEQSAPGNFLKMTAKRYTSSDYPADIRGLTLIFAHGVGGCKEQWEPMLGDLFRLQHSKAPHQRIYEAWAVDRQNHGDAALLNKGELSTSRPDGVSSYEWADAIAAFARSSRMRGKRLVAVSHSAGALALVGSTRAMNLSAIPYTAFVLIEPTIVSADDFTGHIEKTTRRDEWPSREVAHQWMKARYPWKVWDPRMLKALIDHGLTETSDSKVTPKCSKQQESNCYPDTFAHFDSMNQITRIWRTVPVHIIWGTRNDELIPESARGSVSDPSQGRGAASITRMKGGHMLLQESPHYLALTVSQVLERITPVPGKGTALPERSSL
ncbi:Alpha/beta hydrolase family-domain-containing protein [Mycena rebaudengoi]|nr:Alpha/beta hydrolase family-domain-containing protein [Mycena rebaudengoi]